MVRSIVIGIAAFAVTTLILIGQSAAFGLTLFG